MKLNLDRELLDRQIVDRDGRLVGKVDDVAFGFDEEGTPYVATLLIGQIALGQRIGGRLGRLLVAIAGRFAGTPTARALEIPFSLVATVESAIVLTAPLAELPEPPMESWLRRHVIDRIPGARHAGG